MSANPGEEQCLVPGSLTASFSSRADEWWSRHIQPTNSCISEVSGGTGSKCTQTYSTTHTHNHPTYRNTSTLTIDHPPPFLPDIVTIDINLSGFKLPVSPLPPNLTPPVLYKSARGGLEQQQQQCDVWSSVTAVWQPGTSVSSGTAADVYVMLDSGCNT